MRTLLIVLLFIATCHSANAQVPGLLAPPTEEPQELPDPFGRTTPQSLSLQLVEVLASGRYERAAPYFDLADVPEEEQPETAAALARQLEDLLDVGGGLVPPLQLSALPTGRVDDGLPVDTERIGFLPPPSGTDAAQNVPLLAERVTRDDQQVWVVSSETLRLVPELSADASVPWTEQVLPAWTQRVRFAGAPIAQWMVLAGVAVSSFLVLRLLFWGIGLVIRTVWRDDGARPIRRSVLAALGPLSLFLAVLIASVVSARVGVGIVARAQFARAIDIVAVAALVWLLWRLIDVFAGIGTDHLARKQRRRAVAATVFAKRVVKAILVVLGVLTILGALGLNVTTGVAAVGLGGLAIALGAQKAVENLIGGLSIIADEPIRPGDFCKIGAVTGTVEDIGLRSTRIRTLARTVITIPNGQLSTLEIENYSARDRFWFSPVLSLRLETSPDQIRYLLVELRALLYKHPKVISEDARVRFTGVERDRLVLEFFAYIDVSDFPAFLEVQEDLTLHIMEIVGEAGAGFALPSQSVYLTRQERTDESKVKTSEETVHRWRDEAELPLPRFTPEQVRKIDGQIEWPPHGSVTQADEQAELPLAERGPMKSRTGRFLRSR